MPSLTLLQNAAALARYQLPPTVTWRHNISNHTLSSIENRWSQGYDRTMQDTDLQKDIQLVAACGPIRVWSLVVTILGDLCQRPEDFLPGRTLNMLVERLGINNQALRVALHRLRRDGWIRTERDGRASNYFLSDQGRAMTQSVRDQIYTPIPTRNIPIRMVMAAPSVPAADFADLLPDDAMSLSARVALVADTDSQFDDCLVTAFSPQTLPNWAIDTIAPPDLCSEYTQLHSAVTQMLNRSIPASLADRTAMRLVILHHWRRLILRQNVLADILMPADWAGSNAREAVMSALERYARPDLQTLRAMQDGND